MEQVRRFTVQHLQVRAKTHFSTLSRFLFDECLLEVCSDRKQAWALHCCSQSPALHSRSQKWRRARAAATPPFTSATNRQQRRLHRARRHDCDEQGQGQGVAGEAWVDLTPAKHGEWSFNGNRSSVNTLLCECCTYLDPCSQEILTHEVFTHHFLFGSTSGQRAVVFRLSCGGTAALRAPQSLQDFPLFLLSCV